MITPSKTLTPLTAVELELCFQVLQHSLSHPCHKCLELEELTDKINFFRLKAKGIAENNPAKIFPHGIKKKTTSRFEGETSEIPMPTKKLVDQMLASGTNLKTNGTTDSELLKSLEKASKIGERTKRKYNKSKLTNLKPPFGLS